MADYIVIDQGVFGPQNRVLEASFQSVIYLDHNVSYFGQFYGDGAAAPFSSVYPWRSWGASPAIAARSTKVTNAGGSSVTYSNKVYTLAANAHARNTTWSTSGAININPVDGSRDFNSESSSYLARQGSPDEVSYVGTQPSLRTISTEKLQEFCYEKGLRSPLASFLTISNMGRSSEGGGGYGVTLSSNTAQASHNSNPISYGGGVRSLFSLARVSLFEDSYAALWGASPSPFSFQSDDMYALYAYDTDGNVTDSLRYIFLENYGAAFPVTDDSTGLMSEWVWGYPLVVATSAKVVDGKRKWFVLVQVDGLYETTAFGKYYNAFSEALKSIGFSEFDIREGVAANEFGTFNASGVFRSGVRRYLICDASYQGAIDSAYFYLGEDPIWEKATSRWCHNYTTTPDGGEIHCGNLSLHQFWVMDFAEYNRALSFQTATKQSVSGVLKATPFSFSSTGISDTTVTSEAPKQTWQVGQYQSRHMVRKSDNDIVYCIIDYVVQSVAVDPDTNQKVFSGRLNAQFFHLSRLESTYGSLNSGVAGYPYVGEIDRWAVNVRVNARHYNALSLLPPNHAAAVLRADPYAFTGYQRVIEGAGFGEPGYFVFNHTVTAAQSYSNYLFTTTEAGVIGQAWSVDISRYLGGTAQAQITLQNYEHSNGQYFSHRYYLDGDQFKVTTSYLPTPVAFTYDGRTGASPYLNVSNLSPNGFIDVAPNGAYQHVSLTSPYLSETTVSSSTFVTRELRLLGGEKTYSKTLFQWGDFSVVSGPLSANMADGSGRGQTYPQRLYWKGNDLGPAGAVGRKYFLPLLTPPFSSSARRLVGVSSDTGSGSLQTRYPSYVVGLIRNVMESLLTTFPYDNYGFPTGYFFIDSTDIASPFDVAPYRDLLENTNLIYNDSGTQYLSSYYDPWSVQVDQHPLFSERLSVGTAYPIVLSSHYETYNYSPSPGTNAVGSISDVSGVLLWPIRDASGIGDFPPCPPDHGIYCDVSFKTNNRYALVYWKPGADIAWRAANPFLIDGSKMPTLAQVQALVSQDAAALDAHLAAMITDQVQLFNAATTAYNSLNADRKKFWYPPSTYPQEYTVRRQTEWQSVKAELLNMQTVWEDTALASEGGSDTDKDNKIALRKTAAERFWKAAHVVLHNTFLSDSFFIKHPAKDATCVLVTKADMDRLKA